MIRPQNVIALIKQYRIDLFEASLVACVILIAGFSVFLEVDAIGKLTSIKRLELLEVTALSTLLVAGMGYLAYRRIAAQEREIARRISAERLADDMAHRDSLTGLPNRRQFETTLKASLAASPGSQSVHALLLLDLNGFKTVNDVYGHPVGDRVLMAVAQRLARGMRQGDVLARLGGDEFAIIARDMIGPEGATGIALRVIKSLEAPIDIGTSRHRIGIAIGIAVFPNDATSSEELMRKADLALYRSKADKRSIAHFFEERMDRQVREREFLERELAAAIGTPAIEPWYQPIMCLTTEEVICFEALARWNHKVLGDIPPHRFLPIAEDTGLIRELSAQLLRQACRQAMQWPLHVRLAFNLSPVQLRDQTLPLSILGILGETGLAPHRLEIEVTESALVRDLDSARGILQALRNAGVRIALDDFGTGYSSLYHLRDFKFDEIKIDRTFISEMSSETESAAIVRALTGLGNGLGVTITAEGVESWEQCGVLLQQGCSQAQGFLFSQAIPGSETRDFLLRCTGATEERSA